jgi:hypothetical protein
MHNSFITSHIYDGKHLLANHILNQYTDEIASNCDIKSILSAANYEYWKNPESNQIWSDLCQQIKTLFPHKIQYNPKPLSFHENPIEFKFRWRINHSILFRKTFSDISHSKDEALEHCCSQIYTIFDSPKICLPYLSYISKQLEAYYFSEHNAPFPKLNRDEIEFKPVNEYYYPIPKNTEYDGIKKHSALQKYLIGFLQAHGLAKHASKWIGFLPAHIAEEWIAEGNYFDEHLFGEGLTHGKNIHMIHWVLIILMHTTGLLKKDYYDNGKLEQLTPKDIISHLAITRDKNNSPICGTLLDSGSPNSFSLPNTLHTFIMHQGPKYEMLTLSDHMADTFCEGFNELRNLHNKHLKKSIDLQQFYDLVCNQHITGFSIFRVLTPYARVKEELKGNIATTAPVMNYYMVGRKYETNQAFDFNIDINQITNHAKLNQML